MGPDREGGRRESRLTGLKRYGFRRVRSPHNKKRSTANTWGRAFRP